MLSEDEVRNKCASIIKQVRESIKDPTQLVEGKSQIDILLWVLEEAPDPIIVPKPIYMTKEYRKSLGKY